MKETYEHNSPTSDAARGYNTDQEAKLNGIASSNSLGGGRHQLANIC